MIGEGCAKLRVLLPGAVDPVRNMAVDTALLELPGPPTLRIYGWQPAALSIGHFQDPADFVDVPGDHVLVRRPTGGGAIYHDDELTYALTADAAVWPRSIGECYVRIHDALARALLAVGVPTCRVREAPSSGPRPGRTWCFERPGPHDLVTPAGRKIVGSAQRRIRRPRPRVLLHGSLVIRAPHATPWCGAIADCVDPEPVRERLANAVVAEVAAELGLTPEAGILDADELARVEATELAVLAATEGSARR